MTVINMGRNILDRVGATLLRYARDRGGSIMMAFALSLPVVLGSVGFALDLGQAYLMRQRLGAALDASALAGAAMATEEDEIREKVEEFFAANYPEQKIGDTFDLQVSLDGDEVTVSASARFDTVFMRVLGINEMTVSEETIVVREVRGLEVVLVLDITGSMAGSNIRALREAATNFVEILFDRTNDPESIKIGLVPYSTTVNVGSYGIGLTPEGDLFEDGAHIGEPFVVDMDGDELQPGDYTTSYTSKKWYGCVIEYNEDGWDPGDSRNDPYPLDTMDNEGPFPAYVYEIYGENYTYCGGTKKKPKSCYYPNSQPNLYCPHSPVVPLTSDEDKLLDAIDDLETDGGTLGNIGMVWGLRLISPEYPFQQGAAWDDPKWRKVVIMMTDGDNSLSGLSTSAYWRMNQTRIDNDDLNERFAEVCDRMTDELGILIYTVTFTSSINDETKAYYRDCATTPAQYYDAPTQDELVDVFENISRELANLHIRS